MKYLVMIFSIVMWFSLGFILSNTLYAEGRRITMDGDYYAVIAAKKTAPVVVNKPWDHPSRIVY